MNPISDFCGGDWTFMPMSVLADKELPPAAKLLYCAICNHTRLAQGRMKVRPSGQTLAEETGLSRRHIYETARKLEDRGLITITLHNRIDGSKAAHEYEVLPPAHKTGMVGTTCPHPPSDQRSQERTENDKTENEPADKPRERVGDFPTTEAPREHTIVPAEETLPYEPLKRKPKAQNPRAVTLGVGAKELWKEFVSEPGHGPPLANWTPATLAKAGKTILALKDSPFADKTLRELMPLLVDRIRSCDPFVRKSINFGWVFCADAPNLARLLAGDWDRDSGEVEVKVDERPIGEIWPGEE